MKATFKNVSVVGSLLVGLTNVFGQGSPQLPQVYLNTCMPQTGTVVTVCASGCDYNNSQLQQAINDVLPGTTLLLEPGITYGGTYNLPNKTGSGAIIIRSATADANLPVKDTRIDPSYSGVLPKIVSAQYTSAITTDPGAHDYFFFAVEFSSTGYAYNIIAVGNGETSLSNLPTDITFDRVYIHGDAVSGARRGIGANGKNLGVVNSYISDCKEVGADAQAIACWNGTAIKIVNNYLEGSGENVMFGGADPSVPNLVPSDIEFRGNHLKKPFTWYPPDPSYLGTQWCVKNIFELKNAQRVLIEGNIFENNWVNCQSGFSIVLTPRNQDGNAPWSQVADVTFRKNIIRHVASGFNILGTDDIFPSQRTQRIAITDNVMEDIDPAKYGGGGRTFQIISGPDYLTIEHNTIFNDLAATLITADDTNQLSTNFIYRNTISSHAAFGVIGSNFGIGNSSLNKYFPGCIFTNNVLANGGSPGQYPANNYFPANYATVSFVNYNNGVGGDYHLAAGGPYKNQATDGLDIGANIDSVNQGTTNVVAGIYVSCVSQATSIQANGQKDFYVYPNPTTGVVQSTLVIKHVYVLNITGRKVAEFETGRQSIDLSGLADGVYFLQLETDEGTRVQKIVLKK